MECNNVQTFLFIQYTLLYILGKYVNLSSKPNTKRKPNDCVVCGAILHDLGAQQFHLDWRSSVVHLGSQQVEYDPTYHIHLVFFSCHGFNHFWLFNILNWSFLWFWKSIPHGQKAYHMAKMHNTWSCGRLLYTTWHIPNAIACGMLPTMA